MRRPLLALAFVIPFLIFPAAGAVAQSHLSIDVQDGRVSMLAINVSERAILREWTRITGATIVNGDRLNDEPSITLQLTGVSERSALATLLRGASGYVVTLRDGTSEIDRIVVLPKNTAVPPDQLMATSTFNSAGQSAPRSVGSQDVEASTPSRDRVAQTIGETDNQQTLTAGASSGGSTRTEPDRSNFTPSTIPYQRPPTPLAQPIVNGSSTPGTVNSGPPGTIYNAPVTSRMGDASPQPRR